MGIVYSDAPDVKEAVVEVVERLNLFHVVPQFVYCVRSRGSKSSRVIARIHGLGRIWQETLNMPCSYVIEVISENYDCQNPEEKEKTVIHEMLHIPKGFKGGFRHHKGWINKKKIDNLHNLLVENRRTTGSETPWAEQWLTKQYLT
jgi:predicted metallopeptidase